MDPWHGYIMLEKTATLNQTNFDTLRDAFRVLTPINPYIPAHIMHTRPRLDAGAEIFEMKFDPDQISVESFKVFMADLFSVDPGDVEDEILEDVSYSGESGLESRRWGFNYPIGGNRRLEVVRFGRGGTWAESRLEAVGYLLLFSEDWEPA